MTKRILSVLFMMFLAFSAMAQEGHLRGKVIDNKTGETLIGVTVAVVGTTMGTTTDFDGNYSLKLPAGNYNIRISYISYQPQEYENVEINDGDVTVINANLDEVVTELQEVVVTAKAVRNTEAAIQVMQKNSATMLDGISARQISRLGDSDAAAALKRVTGVSVQDDKYVFVRGLGDRYTVITLNGGSIPALDPEKNTVQMDIFPSNIIENIIVHKTFTPDLPGESTGGHVDIVTKDFPEKFTMMFSTDLGYNPQANYIDNFLSYDGGDTDWLGTDDGSRDVPAIANEYLERYGYINITDPNPPYTYSTLEKISKEFNPQMSPTTKKSYLNQSYKFVVGNQVEFLKKVLGYNISLGYTHNYKYYDDGHYGIYEEGEQPDKWRIFDDVTYGATNANLSGLLNLNLKLNNNNKIGARYLRNQSGKKIAISRSGYFYYEDIADEDRNLAFLERTFDNYQLHGKHVFPGLNKLVVNWLGSYTYMKQNEPDLRFFEFLLPDPNTMRIKTNDLPGRFYRLMDEKDYFGKIDFELPLKISSQNAKAKFGGAYSSKTRSLDETKFDLTTTFKDRFQTTDIEVFLREYMISDGNHKGYYYKGDRDQDLNNSYEASQKVIAAYAMIDMPITNELRTIVGARLETSDIEVKNKVEDTTSNLYKHGQIDEADILPSLSLIYSLNKNMNIRLAGSQTIARPKFREIGTNYYDYKTGVFITGNPDLKRSQITNLDLRWEWFFKPGEKVSVSGFYKFFKNPIEQKLSVTTQNYEIKYVNTDEAQLYGLEVEFRKKLEFLYLLRHFTFGSNFTWVYSSVELTEIEKQDTDKDTREMLGQAPWILNTFLSYRYDEIGLESNLGFNVTGEDLILITKGKTPYVYAQPQPMLNFNISKGLGKDKQFTVELGVNNILDSEYRAVHHYTKPVEEDLDYLRYNFGRTYKLGIKYQIN
ncbi:MAG: TonB-dependent receptor [Bacteroidales bacterium]|nr:TonB-dependent receptor [Bacteroidales bacterium]MCF8386852.1 TonB-dependent receptor [Bacteroidales bacterium]MCF8399270.1 TonB-dependent receptor [Bacteroidales bacterium]